MADDETPVIAERFEERFAVENERDLDGGEEQENAGEHGPREPQPTLDHLGVVGEPRLKRREVFQDERDVDERGAEEHDDERPFQNEGAAADREIE